MSYAGNWDAIFSAAASPAASKESPAPLLEVLEADAALAGEPVDPRAARLAEILSYANMGTENYYTTKDFLGRRVPFTYTDNLKSIFDDLGARWLLEAIVSHVVSRKWQNACRADVDLADLSFWTLTVRPTASDPTGRKRPMAILTARKDSGEPDVIRQEIEYTDFPAGRLELCLGGQGPEGLPVLCLVAER